MAGTAASQKDLESLRLTASSTLELFNSFQISISSPTESKAEPTNPQDPFQIASTSSTLVRAHTTKLSLLVLNSPFTPSAICKILRELSTLAVPVLVSAVSECTPSSHGRILSESLRKATLRILKGLIELIGEIPLNGKAIGQGSKGKKGEDGSLKSTGIIWGACDAIIVLQKKGLAGVLVDKINEYKETLNDAISELREWMEEGSDDDDDDDDDEEDDETNIADKMSKVDVTDDGDEFDEMFESASKHLPKGETQLREQIEQTLKKLKLVGMVFQAVTKRRLQSIPPQPAVKDSHGTVVLDKVMDKLKDIPDEADAVAIAFYDLDGKEAQKHLDVCCKRATDAAALLRLDWKDKEDAFTEWSAKWSEAVNGA
jgi:Grap2 and cyclin-D-interacting